MVLAVVVVVVRFGSNRNRSVGNVVIRIIIINIIILVVLDRNCKTSKMNKSANNNTQINIGSILGANNIINYVSSRRIANLIITIIIIANSSIQLLQLQQHQRRILAILIVVVVLQ